MTPNQKSEASVAEPGMPVSPLSPLAPPTGITSTQLRPDPSMLLVCSDAT
jgi:hypothetical protein